jgi:hypothetical protein
MGFLIPVPRRLILVAILSVLVPGLLRLVPILSVLVPGLLILAPKLSVLVSELLILGQLGELVDALRHLEVVGLHFRFPISIIEERSACV